MSEILYNFAHNNSSLEDVSGHLQGIEQVREDIDRIFNVLGTVYDGQGAQAMNAAHVHVSSLLDDAVNHTLSTQKRAMEQQQAMQALDNANAQAF